MKRMLGPFRNKFSPNEKSETSDSSSQNNKDEESSTLKDKSCWKPFLKSKLMGKKKKGACSSTTSLDDQISPSISEIGRCGTWDGSPSSFLEPLDRIRCNSASPVVYNFRTKGSSPTISSVNIDVSRHLSTTLIGVISSPNEVKAKTGYFFISFCSLAFQK